MRRRAFVRNLAGGLLALPLATYAQSANKVYRIGLLREGVVPISKTFWDTMSELGWFEGKNVMVEPRYAKTAGQLPALAKELAELDVDVIIVDGSPATQAAKLATKTIPIVFAIAADPVLRGFVASLARPGANLTGFTFGTYDDKQLQVLKEALPGISRVAYPAREPNPGITRAASLLGLHVRAIPVEGPADLESFFRTVRSAAADAVVFTNVAWTAPHEERIASEAIKARVPLLGTWRGFATRGALIAYGPKESYWPRLAAQVDKIFKGEKASDLPVEQPTKFELIVNLKTAKLLGVTVGKSVLLRADEVIG